MRGLPHIFKQWTGEGFRAPASQSARIRRLAPLCGGRLVCRAVAPLRGVKMRRCSFTSRFASKTIRSLAHFHDAGDEGNALVMIQRRNRRLNAAAIRGPRRKHFRRGKGKAALAAACGAVPWAVGSRHEGRVGVRGRRRLVRAGRGGCRALPSTSRWDL